MEEDFNVNKKIISLKRIAIKKWMNIRKKGEDIKKKQKVFSSGHFLRPQDIGMLSSLGYKEVKVVRKIKVGILSNGNELVEPGNKKSIKNNTTCYRFFAHFSLTKLLQLRRVLTLLLTSRVQVLAAPGSLSWSSFV